MKRLLKILSPLLFAILLTLAVLAIRGFPITLHNIAAGFMGAGTIVICSLLILVPRL